MGQQGGVIVGQGRDVIVSQERGVIVGQERGAIAQSTKRGNCTNAQNNSIDFKFIKSISCFNRGTMCKMSLTHRYFGHRFLRVISISFIHARNVGQSLYEHDSHA